MGDLLSLGFAPGYGIRKYIPGAESCHEGYVDR